MKINSIADDADSSLLLSFEENSSTATSTSSTRFWILLQFVIFSCVQSAAWAIPGAITESLEAPNIYNVSAFTTELWLFYGCLYFVIFMVPFSYWLDMPGGLRGSMVGSIALTFLGCVIRCFALDSGTLSIVLLHFSYTFNGIAGVISMGAVGKISEDWFDRTERGTATAIGSEANPFGAAIIFLVGPALVSTIDMNHVQMLNYLLVAISGANFLCVAIYYPSHPLVAPSASANLARSEESRFSLTVLWTALRKLASSRDFLVLIFSYGFGAGFQSSWASTLQTNLGNFLVNDTPESIQWKAGVISCASTVSGNIAGVILGAYIDQFRGHKIILVACNALGALCFGLFALISTGAFLTGDAAYNALFWSGLLGGLFSQAAIPLYFELSLEASFGLPSGTVIIVLTTFNNIAGGIFLMVPVSVTGTAWMNWAMSGVLALISMVILIFYRDEAKRAKYDAKAAEQMGKTLTAAEVLLLQEKAST